MSVLVNTPTGRIGRRVVEVLLARGTAVTAIARDPAKLGALAGRVRVVQGSIDDPGVLDLATRGVEALFWLSPPPGVPNMKQVNHERARGAITAAKANGVARAVVLSSISAQVPDGTGPIASMYRVEQEFFAAFPDLVVLRPAFFMENHVASLGTIASMNTIFAPIPGSFAFPQIATRDVGDRAADLLVAPAWTGQRVVGLHGPADLTYDGVAATIGQVLGRPMRFVEVTPAQAREGMIAAGLPEFLADAYAEMYPSMVNGPFRQAEPRGAETTTPTTFAQFANEVLKPLIQEQLARTPS